MAFEKRVDEKVKQLADNLRANGLASSDSQALEMAESMLGTADKVQKAYDEQKEASPQGTTSTEEVVARVEGSKASDDEPVPQELDVSKIDADDIFKQQENLIKDSFGGSGSPDRSMNDLMEEDAKNVYAAQFGGAPKDDVSDDSISIDEPIDNSETKSESESVSGVVTEGSDDISEQTSESDGAAVDDDAGSDSEESDADGYEVDKTVEIESEKKSEEDRKKEAESMPESKVDLSDVFNFGK